MPTVSFASPTLTITFTPVELTTLQRVLTSNPGALQQFLGNWLQQRVQDFQTKDVSNIETVLKSATPQTIAQVCQALGIPQT